MEEKIYLKSVNDIDIKLIFCKSNFQWKLLAEKYEEARKRVEDYYGDNIPESITAALETLRAHLVEKKAELPEQDLLI